MFNNSQLKPVIDLTTILHFSHNHCIAICAFLVPASLLATANAALAFFFDRPRHQVRLAALLASSFPLVLILHVLSWFVVGVVTPVTFILSGLAATCLAINGCAVILRSWTTLNSSTLAIMVLRGAVMVSTGWRKPICDTGRE
jgi:ATP/ADP translocase